MEEVVHAEPVRITSLGITGGLSLGSGIASVRAEDFPDLLPRAMIPMSAVMGQGGIGSCTVFAIVAALESLTNVGFSEAELYIRAKTRGRSSRDKEGCYLSEFIPLLREGVVIYSRFPSYSNFIDYIKARKKGKLLLTYSADYRESIEEFKTWCERYGRDVPADMRPRWREEEYRERVDDPTVPAPVKVFCRLHPGYWGIRLLSLALPLDEGTAAGMAFDRIEDRTRHVLEPDSYYPRRFRMYPADVYSESLPKDPFYNLKYALSSRKPVVMSSKIYKMPEERGDLWDKLWFSGAASVIELPPRGAVYTKINHAICLCGYDDERRAFRFKNSWKYWDEENSTWVLWGDNGYAWITYDYVRAYTNCAFVIETL